ncbi:MAG: hypothetical protein JW764_01505 [Chlorobiaceae bacterium]|nr:hypothetical protein [Chlorobiaceae bacterium]
MNDSATENLFRVSIAVPVPKLRESRAPSIRTKNRRSGEPVDPAENTGIR